MHQLSGYHQIYDQVNLEICEIDNQQYENKFLHI